MIVRSSQVETKQNVFVNIHGSAVDFAKARVAMNKLLITSQSSQPTSDCRQRIIGTNSGL